MAKRKKSSINTSAAPAVLPVIKLERYARIGLLLLMAGLSIALAFQWYENRSNRPVFTKIERTFEPNYYKIELDRPNRDNLLGRVAETLNNEHGYALLQAVNSGELLMVIDQQNFVDDPGNDALFEVCNVQGKRTPMIVVSTDLLSSSKSDAIKAMVLFHEFEHYLQYKRGDYPIETFFGAASGSPEPSDLRNTVYQEVEAMGKECTLANERGWTDEWRECGLLKTEGPYAMAMSVMGRILRAHGETRPALVEETKRLAAEYARAKAGRT